mmetsp:Transcript_8936/g.28393  ORF Transcript_8936/g.28393 Transcript_8936/m.28393 type:complete len:249 (+) Transcript_8936:1595-2341(+)
MDAPRQLLVPPPPQVGALAQRSVPRARDVAQDAIKAQPAAAVDIQPRGEHLRVVVGDDEKRRVQPLSLVHKQMAPPVLCVVGDHHSSARGLERAGGALEELLRFRTGRGAHVEDALAGADLQHLRGHHRNLLLPTHVAELHLLRQELVERRERRLGRRLLWRRVLGRAVGVGAADALAAQHRARHVEPPRQPSGQPRDRCRRWNRASAGHDELLHPLHVLALHPVPQREGGRVVGPPRDAERDAERRA